MRQLTSILLCFLWAAPAAADGPKVTVTLKPLHSLTARLLAGRSPPHQLISGSVSPHRYAPRPSEVRLLHGSDLVVWVGESVEPGLTKVLKTLGAGTRVVALSEAPRLTLLPARKAGAWPGAEDGGATGRSHAHGPIGDTDPHFWLDPRRAASAAGVIARALIDIDPAGEVRYRDNLRALRNDLENLDRELEAMLAPVAGRPIFVFHDAYQYLERRYGLRVLGAVTVSPDRPPGAKRLIRIRERLRTETGACVLLEPQFKPALAQVLIEGTGAHLGSLDPLGADLPAGPEHYFDLMRAAAHALLDCTARGAKP
jgi:zinc transport system substrate-binding protein